MSRVSDRLGIARLTAQNLSLGQLVGSLTAAGTNSQANSTALGAENSVHIITTCAASTAGMRLPTFAEGSSPGDVKWIVNGGAAACQIFPGVGDSINDLAANASYSVGIDKGAILLRTSSTTWVLVAA